MKTPTICLSMIVKNEAAVIARCLKSLLPIIDHWVIADTGSTDNTPEIIQDILRDIPGTLLHSEWKNFAQNRNEAMALAETTADYVLLIDADMIANLHEPFKADLTVDSYLIRYDGELDYCQTMLVKSAKQWRYSGVTHEYIHCNDTFSQDFLPQLTYWHFADGGERGQKFTRDKAMLRQGLQDDPQNARYMFYLAQTLKGLSELEEAITWYQNRVNAGGWPEEVWYAHYQIAECKQRLGHPWPEVLTAYLTAYNTRPTRAEALYPIVKAYREQEAYELAYQFGKIAMAIPYPKDVLFIEKEIYDHHLPFEFAIACYYTHHYSDSIVLYNRLLKHPTKWTDLIIKNRRFSLDKVFRERYLPTDIQRPIHYILTVSHPTPWINRILDGFQNQEYPHKSLTLITDQTLDLTLPESITLVHTPTPQNTVHDHILNTPQDAAVVLLDETTELTHPGATREINQLLNAQDCQFVYGLTIDEGNAPPDYPFPNLETFNTPESHTYVQNIRVLLADFYRGLAGINPDFIYGRPEWKTTLLNTSGFYKSRFSDRPLFLKRRIPEEVPN